MTARYLLPLLLALSSPDLIAAQVSFPLTQAVHVYNDKLTPFKRGLLRIKAARKIMLGEQPDEVVPITEDDAIDVQKRQASADGINAISSYTTTLLLGTTQTPCERSRSCIDST